MSSDAPLPPLPKIYKQLGTAFVLGHFFIIGIWILGATSGPWPSPFFPGGDFQLGPPFAQAINPVTRDAYLGPLRLLNNYHFMSNRVVGDEAYFQIHFKDASGKTQKTLKFPDENANYFIRHRHKILALGLTQDREMSPLGAERIRAVKKQAAKTDPAAQLTIYWTLEDPKKADNKFKLVRADSDEVPRGQALSTASDWAYIAAQSYVRHVLRETGEQDKWASVELTRHVRRQLPPLLITMKDTQINFFGETVSNFGDLREKP